MSDNSLYSAVRASVDETGSDSRVEVNQRALIDKILARYASAGAVYRELLQNSNDADATVAEVHFTTEDGTVKQVMYRNNGLPFRDQDWNRLKKIAEGNPSPEKVGAFGVGAYTMFSICEEPLVISGDQALAFFWKGDALWTKTASNVENQEPAQGGSKKWTTFVLPSRDPYPLPSMVEFAQFLCASLTFTKSLHQVRVMVDGEERVFIQKTQIKEPTLITPPQSSSWWKNDGAVTASREGTFYLSNPNKSVKESIYQIDVLLDGEASSIQARYVSARAKTRISSSMASRMERVTKKQPPSEVNVEIFLNAGEDELSSKKKKNKADLVTDSFSPQMGKGRIFIGFRTSQTTGLAAHLAAPFIPTVEREAIDLQDTTLKLFNSELLEFSGILMRLSLEHAMSLLEEEWKENAPAREKLEKELEAQIVDNALETANSPPSEQEGPQKKGQEEDDDDDKSSASGLFGFAKFMAKGLKKQIVSVASTVDKMLDDGSEYLNPKDARPLSSEERHAILLMQSFCPEQSTPDPLVGTCLANGFSRCMPDVAPPVLTRSGVIRGDDAKLPHQGMETFVKNNVIRKLVYANCKEYHDVIARSCPLQLEDVARAVSDDVFDQSKMVFFLKWWTKYNTVDPYSAHSLGMAVKDAIRFYRDPSNSSSSRNSDRPVVYLKDFQYYIEKEGLLTDDDLPMPESVLPKTLQSRTGLRTLTDSSLRNWFSPIPTEVWLEFISHHQCIKAGRPEDEKLRMKVLSIFSKEYDRRARGEQAVFGGFCKRLLGDKRCIPFDSSEPSQFAGEIPSNLYLSSAELKAFDGLGSFQKVSKALKAAGISEEFLLELGVRKSISIEFLFSNLDTLKWSKDPKPLVEYLRSATLTNKDVSMLKQTQYLPSENDESRTFAPSELFLPDPDLRLFPFVRILQWPSEESLTTNTPNGKFLASLGCHVRPSLETILHYISNRVQDSETRIKCLDFLCKRMGPHGVYQLDYNRLPPSRKAEFRIIPCTRRNFLQNSERAELCSPGNCYSDKSCAVMCYSIIDPKLESSEVYATIFQLARAPPADTVLEQLVVLIQLAKKMLGSVEGKNQEELSSRVIASFLGIFQYLSTRTAEFNKNALKSLRTVAFIPLRDEETGLVNWYKPEQIYFKPSNGDGGRDSLTEMLFKAVEYNGFLSAVGVKEEASARDLFLLLLSDPETILNNLGEKRYRTLLRRIAGNPPFTRLSPQITDSPFLLAYKAPLDEIKGGKTEATNFQLAKAEDIYVIDNSFFGRMFPVLKAPHESDLEDFYCLIGSKFISKEVNKRFEIVGRAVRNTDMVQALAERIEQRTPLLLSPHVTSRPLVPNAESILDRNKLSLFHADGLLAVFSLGRSERRQRTTCCYRPLDRKKNAMYVTTDFDWFDVGYAIGDLILQRCELQDAFFISSLLEAPLEQLRARGFPVDRVLKPEPLPEPMAKVATPVVESGHTPPSSEKPAIKKAAPASATEGDGMQRLNTSSASKQTDDIKKSSNETGITAAAAEPASPTTEASTTSADAKTNGQDEVLSKAEIFNIMKQMFPDVDDWYLSERLGPKPTMDDVHRLAEEMAAGKYVRNQKEGTSKAIEQANSSESNLSTKGSKRGKSGLRKTLGRAIGNFRGHQSMGSEEHHQVKAGPKVKSSSDTQAGPATGASPGGQTGPVAPEHDAANHSNMCDMLQRAAGSSAPVKKTGVESADTVLTNIPKELDRGTTCEVIPGQSLKPFPGQRGDGRTHNGIQVFSARNFPKSQEFLEVNHDAIECFSLVLKRLGNVFDLPTNAIAIFHDPTGGTIAFNANKSLHFNARFFYSLHYLQGQHESYSCYSYWFVTFAHELAHNLVSGHNKEHGFYTENYASLYLPKLLDMISTLPEQHKK